MPGENKQDGRWWEFYAVRYFVGTVLGAAVVLYLNIGQWSNLRDLILPGVKDAAGLDAQKITLLAAMGLAYCYIASAPVLVFHATRSMFFGKRPKAYGVAVPSVTVACVALSIAGFLIAGEVGRSLIVVGLLGLVLGLQAILLTFSFLQDGLRAHEYYQKLTKRRSGGSEQARQYVESYRHLREHGNAFLILVFEFALGILLVAAPSVLWAVIILFVWILPAALVWPLGTALEFRFSDSADLP